MMESKGGAATAPPVGNGFAEAALPPTWTYKAELMHLEEIMRFTR
jgi:hypothetical protein